MYAVREIRDLPWEWDSLGVRFARASNDDGYDCMEWPLYERLNRGASADQIATFPDGDLRSHFGITPPPSAGVEVDHTEVALERDLASLITVAAVDHNSAS